jgi:hypothetical protein
MKASERIEHDGPSHEIHDDPPAFTLLNVFQRKATGFLPSQSTSPVPDADAFSSDAFDPADAGSQFGHRESPELGFGLPGGRCG